MAIAGDSTRLPNTVFWSPRGVAGLAAGWIAWAVEGFSAWQQREGLQPPAKVLTAVQHYRTETDTVGQFLDDFCKENLEAKASAKDLYDAYRGWCYPTGRPPWPNTN